MTKYGFNIHMPSELNAGIFQQDIKFTTDYDFLFNVSEADRNDLRVGIARTFQNSILDGVPVLLTFFDECPDCLHIMERGKCVNPKCIRNIPKA